MDFIELSMNDFPKLKEMCNKFVDTYIFTKPDDFTNRFGSSTRVDYIPYSFKLSRRHSVEDILSIEYLNKIKIITGNAFENVSESTQAGIQGNRVSISLNGDLNESLFDNKNIFKDSGINDIVDIVSSWKNTIDEDDDRIIQYRNTGLFWYPANSWCGWHTNTKSWHTKADTYRIYLYYAQEDKKSFFRYIDRDTGEMITKWDKKGWNINKFTIGTVDSPLWHCVGSYTNRISIGFGPVEK
tara:strand:+ start:55 stop:777 length:723 start_codon:yes stop_codon:yes gene_type:complete